MGSTPSAGLITTITCGSKIDLPAERNAASLTSQGRSLLTRPTYTTGPSGILCPHRPTSPTFRPNPGHSVTSCLVTPCASGPHPHTVHPIRDKYCCDAVRLVDFTVSEEPVFHVWQGGGQGGCPFLQNTGDHMGSYPRVFFFHHPRHSASPPSLHSSK